VLAHCRHCAALHTEEKEEESANVPHEECIREICLHVTRVVLDGLDLAMLPCEVVGGALVRRS
jgi:hypothetical protein